MGRTFQFRASALQTDRVCTRATFYAKFLKLHWSHCINLLSGVHVHVPFTTGTFHVVSQWFSYDLHVSRSLMWRGGAAMPLPRNSFSDCILPLTPLTPQLMTAFPLVATSCSKSWSVAASFESFHVFPHVSTCFHKHFRPQFWAFWMLSLETLLLTFDIGISGIARDIFNSEARGVAACIATLNSKKDQKGNSRKHICTCRVRKSIAHRVHQAYFHQRQHQDHIGIFSDGSFGNYIKLYQPPMNSTTRSNCRVDLVQLSEMSPAVITLVRCGWFDLATPSKWARKAQPLQALLDCILAKRGDLLGSYW